MVDIQPFRAIRPRKDLVRKVASLPYDVVSRKEATELAKDNPYSYLHIDRSEVDLPELENVYADEVYEKAAENLEEFQKSEWLKKEDRAFFYIYELTFQGRSQTGLVVTASVWEYLNDKIKKHEFTRYEKEKDRIRHMDAADATTSPIFLTYREEVTIDEIINKWKENSAPVYDFESYYETQHKVWVIDNKETNEKLQALFEKNVPALYIADGHHRTASAAKVAQKRKETGRLTETGKYFLSVLFPINQLHIYDYNRLVTAEPPENFLELLADDFDVTKVAHKNRRPKEKHTMTLYLNGNWYQLKAKETIISEELVESLDASIAQKYIFEKYFDIADPREDNRLDFVGGIKGLDILEKAVNTDEANFALALYATEKEDLLAVSDQGKTMPPKSTWFEPKLLSGLFVHDLASKDE
jgi:uncharacterized protein (DUF1015 family)